MAVLKLICGIFFALLAVFAGGCAVFFAMGTGFDEAILLFGVIPAAISGLFAYLCLRKPRAGGEGT